MVKNFITNIVKINADIYQNLKKSWNLPFSKINPLLSDDFWSSAVEVNLKKVLVAGESLNEKSPNEGREDGVLPNEDPAGDPNLAVKLPVVNNDSDFGALSILNENEAAAFSTSWLELCFSVQFKALFTSSKNSSANSAVLNLKAKSSGDGSFSEKSVAAQDNVLSPRFSNLISFVR